jgi:hypothetical protein
VQDGFHSMEKIVVNHDDHGIVIVSTGARDIVRYIHGYGVGMTKVVFSNIVFPRVSISSIVIIGQEKVMRKSDVFINNKKVVHVLNPSRLGGPTINLENKILECYV